MRFYTNVQLIGNKFLVRGYDNGEHVQFRDDYNPTLFVPTKKESKYKTLTGESVEPIRQYISDKYPEDEIKFDISKIRLVTLDIEVKSENGFPDPETADQELLLISIQDYNTKQIITWGVKPFNNKQKNVTQFVF